MSTMDFLTIVIVLSAVALIYQLLRSNAYTKSTKLPPGPSPIPIIGNLLQLGRNPHRSIMEMSKIYGPLMHLKLGSRHAIIASSPEMAREILQKHDINLSSRRVPHVVEALNHHEASIVYLPQGSKWRKFRKICKEQMFTVSKLEASEGLRKEKLQQMRNHLEECCRSGRVVNVGEVAFVTTLNLITATLFSADFAEFDSESCEEIKGSVTALMRVSGTTNLADYFPFLRMIDPQGLKRQAEYHAGKLLDKFEEIITGRLRSRNSSARKKDLLEVLLDLVQKNELSTNDIKHLFLDLLSAGTHTNADTLSWAMTELLSNPNKMWKAKNELNSVIGTNKQMEEADISTLPYLNSVIKETLRRHPAAPLLIPHRADADVQVNGYTIPKGAQILVNVWAIGRDPSIWSNPDSFQPERFLDSKVDYKGQDFELLSFGSGRRICPGIPLAQLMVHLMLASMVHNFEWELEPGMKPEEMDMNEAFGFSLQKAMPLKAIPIKRGN